MIKTNFHTHVYRCGHATGDVKDYVKEAIENGYSEIGISDHGPLPDYLFDRMSHKEIDEYLKDIDDAIEEYGDKIKIYKALELEYFKEFDEYYKNLKKDFDYFVLGHHYYNGRKSSWHVKTAEDLEIYVNEMMDAMESGHFDFVAHPDLFAVAYPVWDENCIRASQKICNKALELDLPIELNANGIRKGLHEKPEGLRYNYPRQEFWEIAAKLGVKVMVNSDCHYPYEFHDESMKKARELAAEWKLKVINKVI